MHFQRKFSKDDGGEEVEQMPEIELSSDSEGEVICIFILVLHKWSQGDEEEVSLIVLKRPPLKELHVEVEVCT